MERIIFLDRDGTLNEEVHYLHRKEDLKLLPGVPQAIRMLREKGYKIVVVTNQAGIARGYYQESDVEELHAFMNEMLRQQGAWIDAFFYCPHHPEHGIGKYKKLCHCRKPDIGMFEMAEQYFPVDKAHSWMIGDKRIDVEAGRNFGLRTVLVGTGYGREVHQELTGSDGHAAKRQWMDRPPEGISELTGGPKGVCREGTYQEGGRFPYDVYAESLIDAAGAILESEDGSRQISGGQRADGES